MKCSIPAGSVLVAACCLLFLACGGSESSSPVAALTITSQPASVTLEEGQTATFSVTASGHTCLGYQWRKNGALINGARSSRHTTSPASLTDDGARFSVVVTDSSGASVASADALLSMSAAVRRTQHYVDPVNGSDQGDGSSANPWKSLQEVVDHQVETRTWQGPLPYSEGQSLIPVNAGAPVKGGDTIWLRSGDYGALSIQSAYNAAPVTITAESGSVPRFSSVLVRSSQHWILRGWSVSPSFAAVYSANPIVTVENHNWRGPAWDITIDGFQIFSVPDERVWTTRADWDTQAAHAVIASGGRVDIRRCSIRNVRYGISLSGEGSRAEYNLIDGFCGDGLRGLGNNEAFEYNQVRNARDVNDDHRDGFQSWSVGPGGVGTGTVRNIVLRGNVILGYEDPAIPFAGTLQGIGCFDGFFDGWIVENNVIITDHWHGISFYGARNLRLLNNTVLDLNSSNPGPPWIMVTARKAQQGGEPSVSCVIRNNLTTALNVSGEGHETDHNLLLPGNPIGYFADLAHHDVRLAAGSPAIDQGSAILAPALDADEAPRPQGAAHDVGAYESGP